eukprot:scaffold322197_cov15-Tisochrysis_lutea.AAC.1
MVGKQSQRVGPSALITRSWATSASGSTAGNTRGCEGTKAFVFTLAFRLRDKLCSPCAFCCAPKFSPQVPLAHAHFFSLSMLRLCQTRQAICAD